MIKFEKLHKYMLDKLCLMKIIIYSGWVHITEKMVKAYTESMLAFIYLLFHRALLLSIVKVETHQLM